MTTVDALIDRTLRDWLEPADDQPTRLQLAVTVDRDDLLGVAFNATLMGPEELELLAPGTLVQIDSEEVIIAAVDESAGTVDFADRGVNGTTAAAHTSGAFMYPHPVWRRRVIFDAIGDAVVQLFPELYRVARSQQLAVSDSTFTEIPAADADLLVAPMWLWGQASTSSRWSRYPIDDAAFLDEFPGSSTGKAVYVPGLPIGGAGYLIYKAKFARPEAPTDDLELDMGVPVDWHQLIVLAVVAYLVAGRELDHATQKRLAEQLEQQNYPAGTPSKIRDSLLRYRQALMERAKDELRDRYPVTVSSRSPW